MPQRALIQIKMGSWEGLIKMGRYFKGAHLSLSWNLKLTDFNNIGSPAVLSLSFVTPDVSPKASTFGVRIDM